MIYLMTKRQKRKHKKKLRHSSTPSPSQGYPINVTVDDKSILEINVEKI